LKLFQGVLKLGNNAVIGVPVEGNIQVFTIKDEDVLEIGRIKAQLPNNKTGLCTILRVFSRNGLSM